MCVPARERARWPSEKHESQDLRVDLSDYDGEPARSRALHVSGCATGQRETDT